MTEDKSFDGDAVRRRLERHVDPERAERLIRMSEGVERYLKEKRDNHEVFQSKGTEVFVSLDDEA